MPRHVCVLLDEAYCEFNTLDDPDTTLDLLAHHPNLILLRTFSKVYGLAGLRVGLRALRLGRAGRAPSTACASRSSAAPPAQAAAIEALRHQDAVAERVERAVVARVEIAEGLERARRRRRRLAGELLLADAAGRRRARTPAAVEQRVVAELRERGVLVRAGSALGRAGCLRVTYGTPEQNARFLAALADALALAAT